MALLNYSNITKKIFLRIAFGPFIFCGFGPLYDILVVELNKDGIYITFPPSMEVAVGDCLLILRPLGSYPGVYFSSGRARKIIGKVKVLKIIGDGRVDAQRLEGKVVGGCKAEKLIMDRR